MPGTGRYLHLVARCLVVGSVVLGATAAIESGPVSAAPPRASSARTPGSKTVTTPQTCPPLNSGNWAGSWVATGGSPSGGWSASFNLSSSLTGTVDIQGYGSGAATGTVTCDQITFGNVGGAITFSGTIDPSGLTMSGSWTAAGFSGSWSGQYGGASASDDDQDGIPDALEKDLAEKYAPTLMLEANEPNMPVNVDWALAHTGSLNFFEKCFPVNTTLVAVSPLSTQDDLLHSTTQHSTCGNDLPSIASFSPNPDDPQFGGSGSSAREAFYLPNVSTGDQKGETDPSQWETYVHSYPTSDGGIMLQYWHVFSYNDYQHRFCPLVCTDQHGSDWDAQVQVQLNAQLQPEGVWFSRHTHDSPGDFVGVGAVHWTNGTHPLVSIDSGGHGAYASPDDFCAYHQANFGFFHINPGDAPWSDNGSPAGIKQIECDADKAKPESKWTTTGGTVWDTSTGGSVTQSVPSGGSLAVALSGNVGGPIVLTGQYNPGTETCGSSCAGIPSGTSIPLNGQSFIGYSGFWGDPTQTGGVGFPPRGPVFQGFNDSSGQYTSWYNQASTGKWQPSAFLLDQCGIDGLTSPCPIGAPSVPLNVQDVAQNGGVSVSWTPPTSSPAGPVTGYLVTAVPYYTDRVPSPPASSVAQTVSGTSVTLSGLVEDCHERYVILVSAENAAGAGSATISGSFRPSGVLTPRTPPSTVVILLDGINESKPGFRMDPYSPTADNAPSYCPESWNSSSSSEGEADFNGSPKGPWEFFNKWNFADPGSSAADSSNSTPTRLGRDSYTFVHA